MKSLIPLETVVKKTISKCHVCRHPAPAQVIRQVQNGREQVVMRRTCEHHGTHEFVIASDARFYWHAEGNPLNKSTDCGCSGTCSSVGGGKGGFLGINALDIAKKGTIERLKTCLALIEITDSCNLECPTCFSNSPLGWTAGNVRAPSFENITSRIKGIIDRKGPIEIIQFSGGEPTIHPEFFRLCEWVRSNPDIEYLVVNTNGVRLAQDLEFVKKFDELLKKHDNIQLYLQFDGPQFEGQKELRGADLRAVRRRAIENCERIGLPITLAMTVNDQNINYLWDTVEFARKYEHIRGVSFQPMFLSGRNPNSSGPLAQPITTADIIVGLNEQSGDFISVDDFTPLPCGAPQCATIGWLMRLNGKYYSPTEHGIVVAKLQKTLPDRINYRLEDLMKCGCDNTPLGNLMKKMEIKESNAFRLFIKPFMDARTWDEDRTDRCCTHVIKPDGQLESFCKYYFGAPAVKTCCGD